MDTARGAAPSVSFVVDDQSVAVGIVSYPCFDGFGGALGPFVDCVAILGACDCLLARILANVHSRPASFAQVASDETFILAESDHAEFAIPAEVVPFDRFRTPCFPEFVHVLFTILV